MNDGGNAAICNIAAVLPAMAALQPDTPAIIFPRGRDSNGRIRSTQLSYRDLDQQSDRLARGFTRIGIGRGVRVVLMVKPSPDFFALTFALFKAGAVPVMVDPGIGLKSLKQCLGEAEPHAFVGIPVAHAARVVLGWGRATIKTCVTVGRRWFWGGLTLDQVRAAGDSSSGPALVPTTADDLAAILFTSGSTGVPKGVVYRHGNFVAQVEMIRRTYDIKPGEIDLPTFPLFALFDPGLGMTAVIPEMDAAHPAKVDPRKIIQAIEAFGVTNMFGSPAVLNRVGNYGVEHGVRLPTLGRVLSAGAPVAPRILEQFTKMLSPGVQVFTPYGATESLPVASVGSDEILTDARARTDQGAGICVGRAVDGTLVTIVPISDDAIERWDQVQPLPAGQVGEIVVRGPTITRAYYNRDKATRFAKIALPDGGVAHRMGDLGYFDERGRLWFCGRKSHRVITASGTLFTEQVEGIFNAHAPSGRTALVGVKRGDVTEPVLCVEVLTKLNAGQVVAGLQKVAAQYDLTHSIKTIVLHFKPFPVDIRHNSKIFREKLAVWAAGQLA